MFQQAIKFNCLVLAIFQSFQQFLLFFYFIFLHISAYLQLNVAKYA